MSGVHRVVIVGGGFGGLYAALSLRREPVEVTLIDRRNFHLFQPLLYQVATGFLSPANIAAPLRLVLKRQRNVRVLLADVIDVDPLGRRVVFRGGEAGYDSLVLATGARHHYFGHESWEPLAPGLKDIEDATEIRGRILSAFERAELERDAETRRAWLTFVVVGAGPTGVELAGALAELARDTLRREFRSIDPAEARILLLEGLDRVLPPYHPELSRKAEEALGQLGVTVRKGCRVTAIEEERLRVRMGDSEEEIRAHTVLWAAGNRASPLGKVLAEKSGAALDPAGRVVVEPDLSLKDHPEVFVIGDLACVRGEDGQPLPAIAPVAMQEGRCVAQTIARRLRGEVVPPFRYRDQGNLATIGRSRAVAQLGRLRFSGFFAWLLWLFIHLMHIVEFENRVLVFIQWAWNYFTRNRNARLITGGRRK